MKSELNETQKAGITEMFFALNSLLGGDGKISLATPFVDDEGVDLIVYRRKLGGKVLYLQIKSRFTLTKKGYFKSQVRKKSFSPRKDLYLAFVYFDVQKNGLGEILWLIPTLDFIDLIKGQRSKKKIYVFQSKFTSRNDMWAKYKITLKEMPQKLLELLQS